jgi:FkbM family methyltransferase
MEQIDITKFNNLESYSQDKQDLFVLDHLHQKRNGFFVDVGAGNYMVINNTYLLEKRYDWTGICIEGNPICYQSLVNNRSCICVNRYVSINKEKTTLNYIKPKEDFEEGYYSFIDVNTPVQQLIKRSCGERMIQIQIETELLMTILDENNAPQIIDYLAIDIEGLDFQVLQTIDLNKYKFRVITIEDYIPNVNSISPQSKLITEFLKPYDYKMVGRLSQDIVYINTKV